MENLELTLSSWALPSFTRVNQKIHRRRIFCLIQRAARDDYHGPGRDWASFCRDREQAF